ncbi:tRNA lysidine(34) synthetase TilS [Sphingomonas aracearum]|uniref:tRNA(Ile)-lysidine synthase n=1 Tax=Sphingomonas aracearum TaxID=2283317 RepID=A0A369VUA3_9SPHN|nr:tRNA lysidine(34) synthetase TilS [Sphingomonas aracearum]RDE04652.1 tRNA lysidine(34) synthetase TilS [Sphingomonas aracearum]
MSAPLPKERIARFRRDLLALASAPTPDRPLGIAVSGGPDSMALLVLADAAFPGAVAAATVDHRLRPASAAEAAMVARWCAAQGVPHAVLPSDEDLAGADLQARARALRYRLLGQWSVAVAAPAIATAHHADDQAETFLMRAARGAGPAGLAGIRPVRALGAARVVRPAVFDLWERIVVRPLLGWRRAELRALVSAAGVPFVDDPSNTDESFERVRVRRLLAEQDWLGAEGLARAAAHAGEAQDALEAMTAWLWSTRKVVPEGVDEPHCQTWLDLADLPREMKRRLAREAIRSVRGVNGLRPDFDLATNIEPLLNALEAGNAATQAGVLVRPVGTVWRFSEAPPRRSH